jgi:hypothetical protein
MPAYGLALGVQRLRSVKPPPSPEWLASPTKDDVLLFLVAENWNDSDEGFDSGFDNGFG